MFGIGTAGYSFVQGLTGNGIIDSLMVFSGEYAVLVVPAALVYLWLKGNERTSLFSFYTVVSAIAFSYLLGALYSHQPPHLQDFETILMNDPVNSFPSQHSSAAFALVWPLLYRSRRKLAYVALAAAFLTGFGRVYTGLHFPFDILGGITASVLGFGTVYLVEEKLDRVSTPLIQLWERILDTLNV